MILKPPLKISARLMASIQIGDTWISVEKTEKTERNGKPCWFYAIDNPAWNSSVGEAHDLYGWADARGMLTTLLGFLGACAESRAYGLDSENKELFPEPIGAWAEENQDEIQLMTLELEETVCTAEEQEEGLWGCKCRECLTLQLEATLTRGEA